MEIVIGVLALIVGAAIGAGITYYFTKPRLAAVVYGFNLFFFVAKFFQYTVGQHGGEEVFGIFWQ